MVSQLTVIDAAFLSRSRASGGDKKDAWRHEARRRERKNDGRRGGGEKKIKLAEKQMPGCALAYPLSAKETQQQIAALHC